jgi:two-component system response regulator NreC
MPVIKVLVVDDHTIVRDGICSLLGVLDDIEVVGQASNGKEALEKITSLCPDVVLMDIAMPIMGGLEATRRIHKRFPDVKIMVLTQYDDREYVIPIIEAGASGFISKSAVSSELESGIHALYSGGSFLSPDVASVIVSDYQSRDGAHKVIDPYDSLTDRERDVLKLLAEGYTNQQIAKMLVISPKTVEGHKTNLMSKLDVHNRVDLVKYALKKGIITV